MSRLQNLGMKLDMKQRASLARIDDDARQRKVQIARRIIYEQNYAVNSEGVEKVLKEESLVPTLVRAERGASRTYLLTKCQQNAFSNRLSRLEFDLFPMFVVDLMHEFELGVWKALFIHLLRMLHAVDASLINELDYR